MYKVGTMHLPIDMAWCLAIRTTIAVTMAVAMVAKIGSICKRSLTKWLSFSHALGGSSRRGYCVTVGVSLVVLDVFQRVADFVAFLVRRSHTTFVP
jgi:hypothetical protein